MCERETECERTTDRKTFRLLHVIYLCDKADNPVACATLASPSAPGVQESSLIAPNTGYCRLSAPACHFLLNLAASPPSGKMCLPNPLTAAGNTPSPPCYMHAATFCQIARGWCLQFYVAPDRRLVNECHVTAYSLVCTFLSVFLVPVCMSVPLCLY